MICEEKSKIRLRERSISEKLNKMNSCFERIRVVKQFYNVKIQMRVTKVSCGRKGPLKAQISLTSCKEIKTILDQRQRDALRREKKMWGKFNSLCQNGPTLNEIMLVSLKLCRFSEFHGITCSHINFLSRQRKYSM